jgi:hypothetical protein
VTRKLCVRFHLCSIKGIFRRRHTQKRLSLDAAYLATQKNRFVSSLFVAKLGKGRFRTGNAPDSFTCSSLRLAQASPDGVSVEVGVRVTTPYLWLSVINQIKAILLPVASDRCCRMNYLRNAMVLRNSNKHARRTVFNIIKAYSKKRHLRCA